MSSRRHHHSIVAILALLTLDLAAHTWAQGPQSDYRDPRDYFGPRFEGGQDAPRPERSRSEDAVRRWNEILLVANALDHTPVRPGENRVFGEQLGPHRTSRAFAIVHIAIFDAVNAIASGYKSYTGLRPASSDTSMHAAIAQAAHDTLVELYPSQKPSFDELLAEDLDQIRDRQAQRRGIALGSRAANAEQTLIGIYWGYDGTPGLGTPPRLYNQIVVQIADQMGSNAVELARLLALVNTALADAGIACWESKYLYAFWRPITAIRAAVDPNWTPLGAPASNSGGPNFTPPFPAYTSGHATFGGSVFEILRNFYGTDRIAFSFVSDEFNGVTRDNRGNVRPRLSRRFSSLSQAEEENGQSRIYLGIHWAFDKTEGIAHGRTVGNYVFDNAFQPLRRDMR